MTKHVFTSQLIAAIIMTFSCLNFNLYAQTQKSDSAENQPKSQELRVSEVDKERIKPEYVIITEGKKDDSKSSSNPYIDLLSKSIPLFQTLFWVFLAGFIFFKIRKELSNLLTAFTDRIKKGSSLEIASIKLGSEREFAKNTEEFKEIYKNKDMKVQVVGNPDNLKLLFSAKTDLFSKSTKAISVNGGCIVQVTTSDLQSDGSWKTSEALAFVPGVEVVEDENGGHKLI